MYVLRPDDDNFFPAAHTASSEGLLAIGGDLHNDRLLSAYRQGIFPWYSGDQPILWWSPDPRAVLYLDNLKISRSLGKTLRSGKFKVTMDQQFVKVIRRCAEPRKKDQDGGTWITTKMVRAYVNLHHLGFAHSVETWLEGELVGGLYGVALGRVFFGESMFSRVGDTSKTALVYLARQLQRWKFSFVDCQLPSEHVFSMGAKEIPRSRFLEELEQALIQPGQPGSWSLDDDIEPVV